jgi:microsomal dipeptidase-like Zn-dependent dipeptidase
VIADLHAHYPMHLTVRPDGSVVRLVASAPGRWRLLDATRALMIRVASRLGNYQSFQSGPRVTVPLLRAGNVGVALSVLHSPFDEMDLGKRYGSPPDSSYFPTLMRQLEDVEREVAQDFAGLARVAHDPDELDAALAAGETALVHCVEGGYHLGATVDEVDTNVTELARRGCAYITLAHLFYRGVATNVNAIPFLSDRIYDFLFPMPKRIGLTALGRAALTAMVRERILVDLSHMSRLAMDDTFALLDELDPAHEIPVTATHVAYRYGHDDYNLTAETIERIAARGGVVGLILAEHQAADAFPRTKTVDDSIALLCRHADRIAEIAGSHRHTAIGTDLDGFIKPTLAGLDDAGRLPLLEQGLVDRYGPEDAELIASGNVLRLLRRYWRGGEAANPA